MAAPPAELQAAVDALLGSSSSDLSGDEDRGRSPPAAEHARSKRHKRARSDDARSPKRHKHKQKRHKNRSRRSPTAALAQDDFEKGLQIQIEYTRFGRGARVGQEPWQAATDQDTAAPDSELYSLLRSGDADNLVYGSAYRMAAPSYRRSAWAGLSRVPATFATMLFLGASRLKAALGDLPAADAQPPLLKDRYFSRKNRTGGRRMGAAAHLLDKTCASSASCPGMCLMPPLVVRFTNQTPMTCQPCAGNIGAVVLSNEVCVALTPRLSHNRTE